LLPPQRDFIGIGVIGTHSSVLAVARVAAQR
jgi:hypothetical protein